jgi:hypothetical protein
VTLGNLLRQLLVGDAGIAALANSRVYSEVLPQNGTVPAVVFNVVAGDSDADLEGPTGVGSRRVQIDSWAALLDGYSGGAAGLDVQAVFYLTERWDFEAETKLFRTSQDYEVWTGGVEA